MKQGVSSFFGMHDLGEEADDDVSRFLSLLPLAGVEIAVSAIRGVSSLSLEREEQHLGFKREITRENTTTIVV